MNELNWHETKDEMPELHRVECDNPYLSSGWILGYWPNHEDPYSSMDMVMFERNTEDAEEPWEDWMNNHLEECVPPEKWTYIEEPK